MLIGMQAGLGSLVAASAGNEEAVCVRVLAPQPVSASIAGRVGRRTIAGDLNRRLAQHCTAGWTRCLPRTGTSRSQEDCQAFRADGGGEALIRLTVAMMLEDHGFAVAEAATGEEALRLVEGGLGVDALITDIHLGSGMDGLVLAERARALRPGLPVVFVTGKPSTLRDHPRLTGEAYLPKPFGGDALARLVRDLAAA